MKEGFRRWKPFNTQIEITSYLSPDEVARDLFVRRSGFQAMGTYSTVTDFAKFRGWSTSEPSKAAVRYAQSWIGSKKIIDAMISSTFGRVIIAMVSSLEAAAPFSSVMRPPLPPLHHGKCH